MRERIATLELNASRRAADIEDAARSEARSLIEQAEQQAKELTAKAQQDAESLLGKAREEDAAFHVQRKESFRSFRDSLQGAARETEAGAGRISDELQRLGEKLKEIVGSLTDTSRRFEPEEAPAESEEPCCAEEASAPEEAPKEEIHHCHE